MALRALAGDVAMSGQKGLGTHVSGPLTYGPGVADVLAAVHVTAVSGTTPSVVVSVEQSVDGSTWTAVPGTSTASLTAVGSAVVNAAITQNHARITATVAGSATPTVTFRVAVIVFGE